MREENRQHLEAFEELVDNFDEDEKQIVLSHFSVNELLAEAMRKDAIKDKRFNAMVQIVNYGGKQ